MNSLFCTSQALPRCMAPARRDGVPRGTSSTVSSSSVGSQISLVKTILRPEKEPQSATEISIICIIGSCRRTSGGVGLSEVQEINININNNTLVRSAPSEARIMALILALSLSMSSLDSVRKTAKAAAVARPAQLIEHNTH